MKQFLVLTRDLQKFDDGAAGAEQQVIVDTSNQKETFASKYVDFREQLRLGKVCGGRVVQLQAGEVGEAVEKLFFLLNRRGINGFDFEADPIQNAPAIIGRRSGGSIVGMILTVFSPEIRICDWLSFWQAGRRIPDF